MTIHTVQSRQADPIITEADDRHRINATAALKICELWAERPMGDNVWAREYDKARNGDIAIVLSDIDGTSIDWWPADDELAQDGAHLYSLTSWPFAGTLILDGEES